MAKKENHDAVIEVVVQNTDKTEVDVNCMNSLVNTELSKAEYEITYIRVRQRKQQ